MERPALFVTVIPPIAFALILYDVGGPPWDAMRISGLALAILGMLFVSVARIQLGNSFSVTPQARQLVTHGLYSRIRNPIYLFGTIAIAGLILYLRRPIFLLFLLLLVPMQFIRARQEGHVLEEAFGEEYRRYKASTWL